MPRESNAEFNEKFRKRTFDFAIKTLEYLDHRKELIPWFLINQLSKSATSIGANFRAFCRGRSSNERYAKICIVVEEADETIYWLELITSAKLDKSASLQWLLNEVEEITKVVASIKKGYER
jgi:four helix bundle protein